jgi:hypothetical protein
LLELKDRRDLVRISVLSAPLGLSKSIWGFLLALLILNKVEFAYDLFNSPIRLCLLA